MGSAPRRNVAVTWDLSCPDWAERLRSGRSLVPNLRLNEAEGQRAVNIFNLLRLADVPGTPTMAQAGGEWFREIVRAVFGALDPKTLNRAIREFFLLVPKKNAKTSGGALLMLTALLMNRRPRGTMIMTAPARDVAQIAFDAVRGAIELDGVLSKKLHVREHIKTIVHRESKAELQIMTFDPAMLTGQKLVAALIDELHVVSKMAKAPSAMRQIRGGMLPYPEAFLVFITTQSEEAPAGVFKAELDTARDIRDGRRTGAMLPVLYEFPREMQKAPTVWRDPANWPMVTPNLGRSLTIERLVEDMQVAESKGEAELRAWASQHLNVEIGLALVSNSWAGAQFWERCAIQGGLSLDELLERSEVITVGIDGGGLDDMLGLAVMGRENKTGNWLLWTHAWIHPIVLERRKSEADRFRDFAKDGDLTIVAEIGDDVEELCEIIEKIEATGLLDQVGVDQAGIGAIVDALTEKRDGRAPILASSNATAPGTDRIVGISQGWRLTGAIKTVERKLAEGTLLHGGRKLMAWCTGNAKVEPRGNAIIITKQAAGTAKIDPLMATFDATTLMANNPKPRAKQYQAFFV